MKAADENHCTGRSRPELCGSVARRWGLCLVGWMIGLASAAALAATTVSPAATTPLPPAVKPAALPAPPAPLALEDSPEPLPRKMLGGTRERDRTTALTLFGVARVLEQSGKQAAALRQYQRALRYDPTSGAVLGGVVACASQLRREAELTRYARKAVDVVCDDVLLLSRLGLRLTEQGDWAAAAAVYEKVLAARGAQRATATDVLIRLELGKLYHLLDKYEQGSDCFRRALEALENPRQHGIDEKFRKEMLSDPGALYNLIGDCHLAAGRTAEARSAFEKAHALAPDKPLLGLNQARVAVKEQRPAEAVPGLQAYFDSKLSKEGMTPYRVLSESLTALKRESELIGRLEKLWADDPANVPLGYFLASQYRQAKVYDKAEALYTQLLAKNPAAFGFRGLTEILHKQNRVEPLLTLLGQAATKLRSLDALGSDIKELAEDAALFERLVEAARRQHKADPKQPSSGARFALAYLALERKQYDVAGEFYRLVAAAQPERRGELLLEFGVGLLLADKRSDAIKVFLEGKEKAPPETQFLLDYYLIGALAAEKRYDEALALVGKALGQHKPAPRLEVREGWVLFLAKRHAEARQKLEALVKRLDNTHPAQDVRLAVREAKLILSNIETLSKRLPQAEEWLEQVLDEFPDDASALNDLGYLWVERGESLERALGMVQRAVQDDPDNTAYRDSLGWAHYQLGQYPQAVQQLEKAVAGDKPEGLVLEHLGDAYEKHQQPDKARAAWQRAIKQFENEGETTKARALESRIKGK